MMLQLPRYWNPDILMDDAFISFRYAENLASGLGLVFNAGERVEGYTNFLWVIILAGARKLGFEIVPTSQVLASMASLATLFSIYLLAKHLFRGRRMPALWIALPLLAYAALATHVRYSLSGMETSLFVFLLTWTLLIFVKRGPGWLPGVLFALTAMTRPEGVMYFGLAWGYAVLVAMQERHKPGWWCDLLWFTLSFGLLFGGYFLWRYRYFGYLLPNTYYAKAAGFQWARLERGGEILLELLSWWPIYAFWVLAILALFSWRKNRIWLLFLGLNLATYLYFIYVGGDFIVWFGPRFLMPVLPVLLLAAAEGLANLLENRSLPQKWAAWIGVVTVFVLVWFSYQYTWPNVKFSPSNYAAQMRSWKETGLWLAANTPRQTVIATDAAGLIPYYSERETIDMYGLTDLHIAHLQSDALGQGVVAHERYDPEYVLGRAPDCLVSTWVSPQGIPLAAGLEAYWPEAAARYELVLLAKVRDGVPQDGRWLVETDQMTPELYEQGYHTGVFCRPW
ncbi:MAG: hypothetical protein JW862_08770 [Anaerolineales bacterium]|nr:hypothetical protein [Anaerolineales bacterium]